MKLKRFRGTDSAKLLKLVKDTFGSEAVILSSHTEGNEIEVVAAVDYDESVVDENLPKKMPSLDKSDLKAPIKTQAVNSYSFGKSHEETNASEVEKVTNEVKLLRDMIESQMAGLTWHNISEHNPLQVIILKQLIKIGFNMETAEQLVKDIHQPMSEADGFAKVKEKLNENLTFCEEDLIEKGGTYFFIGPTGVGKTTTIAKIAARFCLKYGAEHCGLITLDNYRIAAFEQLVTYGKILGVNVSACDDLSSLNSVMQKLSDKKLILIDSSGFNPRSPKLNDLMELVLKCDFPIETIMVLAATSQTNILEEALKAYKCLDSKRVILTKTDETYFIATALCALIKARLPLLYLTNGQRVPEDILKASEYQLFKMLNSSLANIKQDESNALNSLVGALIKGEPHAQL